MCTGAEGLSLNEVLASAIRPTLQQLRAHASAVSAMNFTEQAWSDDNVTKAGSCAHRRHALTA